MLGHIPLIDRPQTIFIPKIVLWYPLYTFPQEVETLLLRHHCQGAVLIFSCTRSSGRIRKTEYVFRIMLWMESFFRLLVFLLLGLFVNVQAHPRASLAKNAFGNGTGLDSQYERLPMRSMPSDGSTLAKLEHHERQTRGEDRLLKRVLPSQQQQVEGFEALAAQELRSACKRLARQAKTLDKQMANQRPTDTGARYWSREGAYWWQMTLKQTNGQYDFDSLVRRTSQDTAAYQAIQPHQAEPLYIVYQSDPEVDHLFELWEISDLQARSTQDVNLSPGAQIAASTFSAAIASLRGDLAAQVSLRRDNC